MNEYCLANLDELKAFAKQLAFFLIQKPSRHWWIDLQGEMGAGKTTFTRFFLKSLGFDGLVKSPTYPLMEVYEIHADLETHWRLIHFDFYRIQGSEEVEMLGIADYLNTKALFCLTEWRTQVNGALPKSDIILKFSKPKKDCDIKRLITADIRLN